MSSPFSCHVCNSQQKALRPKKDCCFCCCCCYSSSSNSSVNVKCNFTQTIDGWTVKIVQGTLKYLLDLPMNGIGLGEAISNTLAPFSPRNASKDNTRISKTTRDVQHDSDD
ncbi:hypothetical protein F5890DRAFT_1478390 [Lentinula detonsa]|uniref:Uncharacterized protein n=1 Tax=Lentinula detonsa TaxID=2804962 RepID=A0AA38PQ98_9AGAR|nr:hypothetical protein F5890DRAFT_1478390 [Lentinula detonsa]